MRHEYCSLIDPSPYGVQTADASPASPGQREEPLVRAARGFVLRK